MTAELVTSVILDGNVVEAGTQETPELRKRVKNRRAWSDFEEPDAKPAKKTASKQDD